RSSSVLVRLPLCASATVRAGPCCTIGCAFVQCVEPVVEERQCPIAVCPRNPRSFCSEKACVTRPMSRRTVRRPWSETAIPADSWPRCWRAKSPKYVRRATSRSGAWMPTTPHTSAPASLKGRAELRQADAEQPVAPDHAEAPQRHALQGLRPLGGAGDDCPPA